MDATAIAEGLSARDREHIAFQWQAAMQTGSCTGDDWFFGLGASRAVFAEGLFEQRIRDGASRFTDLGKAVSALISQSEERG